MKNMLYSLLAISFCLAGGKTFAAYIGGLPGSLYGMIIFTLLLHFEWLTAQKIKATIIWIIQHMGVCFVPAGVGIINHYQLIKVHGFTLVAIIFVSTFFLMTVVGLVYERLIIDDSTA